MRRLPDHQLSLFHGYCPEALQVNVCDVPGCGTMHGAKGPCIEHLAGHLNDLEREADALNVAVEGRPIGSSGEEEARYAN